jgi:hypothetical protein
MDIFKDLKEKLQALIFGKTETNQDEPCPHCQVSPETLEILKQKNAENQETKN